jgi:hypothetical protein
MAQPQQPAIAAGAVTKVAVQPPGQPAQPQQLHVQGGGHHAQELHRPPTPHAAETHDLLLHAKRHGLPSFGQRVLTEATGSDEPHLSRTPPVPNRQAAASVTASEALQRPTEPHLPRVAESPASDEPPLPPVLPSHADDPERRRFPGRLLDASSQPWDVEAPGGDDALLEGVSNAAGRPDGGSAAAQMRMVGARAPLLGSTHNAAAAAAAAAGAGAGAAAPHVAAAQPGQQRGGVGARAGASAAAATTAGDGRTGHAADSAAGVAPGVAVMSARERTQHAGSTGEAGAELPGPQLLGTMFPPSAFAAHGDPFLRFAVPASYRQATTDASHPLAQRSFVHPPSLSPRQGDVLAQEPGVRDSLLSADFSAHHTTIAPGARLDGLTAASQEDGAVAHMFCRPELGPLGGGAAEEESSRMPVQLSKERQTYGAFQGVGNEVGLASEGAGDTSSVQPLRLASPLAGRLARDLSAALRVGEAAGPVSTQGVAEDISPSEQQLLRAERGLPVGAGAGFGSSAGAGRRHGPVPLGGEHDAGSSAYSHGNTATDAAWMGLGSTGGVGVSGSAAAGGGRARLGSAGSAGRNNSHAARVLPLPLEPTTRGVSSSGMPECSP